ncbi:CD3324 family protein [Anaerocolumna sp. AGMB13020]|uniref:CD3324 family protein n=1 Tax=Anaerocolumna sp. AGMB13020 TaxID=3081750 RepID=UPI0029537BE9|nr:CD3324 family protein [Anaerocolumna sp. AGMB13020]WOO35265.1 CD3324 family protein [Anaerocolumna sp. AGMB13020]
MKYVKANSILPEYLVSKLQEYTDGCYLYIPRKQEETRRWGEECGSRGKVSLRNEYIYTEFCNGMKVTELSKLYFLSERTIQNIISNQKCKHKK